MGFLDGTFGLDEVTDVKEFDVFDAEKISGSFALEFHEDLDFAEEVADFDEGEFAKRANGGNAAGDGNGFALVIFEIIEDVADFGVAERFGGIGVDAARFDFV